LYIVLISRLGSRFRRFTKSIIIARTSRVHGKVLGSVRKVLRLADDTQWVGERIPICEQGMGGVCPSNWRAVG
jgi:hypothetical protein